MSDPLTYAPDEPDGYKPCPLCGSTIPDEPNELDDLRVEVERLRAEVSYLRACVPPTHPSDYGHEAWAEAVRAEVQAERAAVMEWLRDEAETMNHNGDKCCGPVAACADAIERGEHRREEDE